VTARDLDRELDNAAERHDWLTGRDDDPWTWPTPACPPHELPDELAEMEEK